MPLDEGTKVSITDGDFNGNTATVVGYHNHKPVTYAVLLAKPVKKTVSQTVDMGGGKKAVTEEEVTFTRIEVAEAAVAAA